MGYLHVEKREEKKLFESYKTKTKVLHAILFVVLLVIGYCDDHSRLSGHFLHHLRITMRFFHIRSNGLPEVFRWSNYEEVWSRIPFLTYYVNTIKLSVIVTVGQIITCSLAAYSFSKLHYPGRDKIFLCYLATMMVPWHAIMIPQFIIVKSMGLYDSHWSLIVINLFSAFGVFLLRQLCWVFPEELSEAARIDGCGELKIYAKIVMPMCKPGIATLGIFTFNFMWNDYMGPMIYLTSDQLKTIQIGLAAFRSQYGSEYGLIMAGLSCALDFLLVSLSTVYGQKYLSSGNRISGLKG